MSPCRADEPDNNFTDIPWQAVEPKDIAGKPAANRPTSIEFFRKVITQAEDISMALVVDQCGLPQLSTTPTKQPVPKMLAASTEVIFFDMMFQAKDTFTFGPAKNSLLIELGFIGLSRVTARLS